MADAVDLKSIVRKDVRVRLPPSAPEISLLCDFHQLSSCKILAPWIPMGIAERVDTKPDEVIRRRPLGAYILLRIVS